MFEPLEKRQLLSLVVDLRLPGGAKAATVTGVGQVINMEVWATAKGSNSSGSDEALQAVHGSLLSSNVNGGAANGTLKVTLASPFNGAASSSGRQIDLDGDGDLDVGSNYNPSASDFYIARADSMVTAGTVSGASKSFKIGTAAFTVTSLKSTTGQTNLGFRGRAHQLNPLWLEDGVLKVPSQGGAYSNGSPIVLTRSGGTTTGTLSGKVFNDSNANGALDGTETGRSSVQVYLDANKNGIRDTGEVSKTTDSSGNYSFGGLSSGSYRVRIVPVSGQRITSPSSGYHDVSVSGNTISGRNFGLAAQATTGTLSGKVFNDNNVSGGLDSGETGKSAVKVYLDKNKNGVLDTGEPTKTTDSSGNYSFTGLTSGSYRVRMVGVSGFRIVSPSSGYHDVSISGNTISGRNFALTQKVLVSGRLWVDSNKNGVKDSTEAALGGWQVYNDANRNGRYDSGEPVVTTDSNGNYTFKQLSAGSFQIRVVQKTGYTRISPSAGYYSFSMTAGQTKTNQNFRFTKP